MSQTAEKTAKKPATVLKDSEFDWEDPLDLDGELTEEERMVRDSARDFAQDKLMPRVLRGLARGEGRQGNHAGDGRARPARPDDAGGVRRRRPGLRRLRPDRARDRARRLRLPLDADRCSPRW